MDRDTSRSTFNEVRRSVVRICFNWKTRDKKFMVIAGVIISVSGKEAVIVADATFFKLNCPFVVNFPNAQGYGQNIDGSYNSVIIDGDFCVLTLDPIEKGYVEPVKFETNPVNEGDAINTFIFPREGYITPTSYPKGYIICATSKRVLLYDSKLHEFGYLGSPVFNHKGHLVAIIYLDKGHLQAWTVSELQNGVLRNKDSTLVSNGQNVAEAIEGQNVAEAVEVAEPPMKE